MKKTNIEILDHETPLEQYKQHYRQMKGEPDNELDVHALGGDQEEDNGANESYDLFKNLMHSLSHNPRVHN